MTTWLQEMTIQSDESALRKKNFLAQALFFEEEAMGSVLNW
jgi:hypothetical protein